LNFAKLSGNITEWDLQRKVNITKDLLCDNHQVKITVKWKQEKDYNEQFGIAIINNFKQRIKDLITPKSQISTSPKHKEVLLTAIPNLPVIEKLKASGQLEGREIEKDQVPTIEDDLPDVPENEPIEESPPLPKVPSQPEKLAKFNKYLKTEKDMDQLKSNKFGKKFKLEEEEFEMADYEEEEEEFSEFPLKKNTPNAAKI